MDLMKLNFPDEETGLVLLVSRYAFNHIVATLQLCHDWTCLFLYVFVSITKEVYFERE